jgi:hypothetical protein
MKEKKFSVPKDQIPAVEYIQLKNSLEFTWTTQGIIPFFKTILLISGVIILLLALVFSYKTDIETHKVEFLIKIGISSTTILICIMLRFYLAWEYIYTRLNLATITYEESGWYDGQVWIKPRESLLKDKLIATYEVLPITKRLKSSLILLLCLLLAKINIIYVYKQIIK